MKVILKQDINKKGLAGDVIKVADGFARNYLLPRGIAIMANAYNLSKVEAIRKESEIAKLELENKYKALAAQVSDITLSFNRKADENGHLFGSVSDIDLAEALAEKNLEIHKSYIKLDSHLKNIGEFEVVISFPGDINSSLKVVVQKEQ
ncbi:MAG: 50S ribosomal protein L9 [Candidatus Cloacimonetes bacterium]|nr:50S ribosomal protein L9 [Candidatus Cloacimonadota bacterium]